MNRTGIVAPAVLIGSLLLLLAAAGLELSLNGHYGSNVGTRLLQGGALLTAALFAWLLLCADLSWMRKLQSAAGCVLLVLLPLLYLVNPSHSWKPAVGLLPVPHLSLLPAAAVSAGAQRGIWYAIAAASMLGAGALLRSKQRTVAVSFIVLLATGVALWVLQDRATPRQFPVFPWTGWFVNSNHFAAFVGLVFPVALTTGLQIQRRAFIAGKLSSPAVLFYLVAGILALSVWQVGSRAGFTIMMLQGIGVTIAYGRFMTHLGPRVRTGLGATAIVLLVLAVFYLASQGGGRRIAGDLSFRYVVAQGTGQMWRDRLWWGTGPGSFAMVFPYYQPEALNGMYFQYAHNDLLQALAEWGVLGVLWLSVATWLLLRAGHMVLPGSSKVSGLRAVEASGYLLGLGGVLLHSLVDFPFQHVQILLLACLWVGMLQRSNGQGKRK